MILKIKEQLNKLKIIYKMEYNINKNQNNKNQNYIKNN